jgi:tetratricopeptide (TPR) repeat protein
MSNSQSGFYVTGGTLQRNAPSYVQRQADQDLYAGLSAGKFCYVLTSRQMGKSSLMVRTAARLREEGTAVAVLDLTAIGQNLTAEQWYDGLLGRVGQQLDLEDELDDFWLDNERLGPLQRWMHAIRELVLTKKKGRIVIFVDEIDAVRSLPFSTDEFFAGIREFYNRRTEDPELGRLTFCLLGVATPSDLIRDVRTTPFNIGQRIELTDFSEREAAPLAEGLGRSEKVGTELINRILYWTGGHPYLTQRLCLAVAQNEEIKNTAGVDRTCEAMFLSTRARESDDNLLFVRERILRSEVDRASLLDLYAQIRTHKKRVHDDETNPLISILRLSGITRIVDGYHYVRNRIYYRVFDREWVIANMPDAELRRQRAAYRRGLVRAAAIAAAIIAVMAILSVYAFAQRREAFRQTKEADKQRDLAENRSKQLQQALANVEKEKKNADAQRDLANQRAEDLKLALAKVEEEKKNANQQRELAQQRQLEAERQRQQAIKQQQIAEEQRRVAVTVQEKLKSEVLEERKQNFSNNSTIAWLAQNLISLSSPREAVVWRYQRAEALSMMGQHKSSAEESTAALETEPGYLSSLALRGYMYMLTHEPAKSVADYDAVIKVTPNSSLPYLNRAISHGQLGQYPEALADINKAIELFKLGEYETLTENEVAPDIKTVLGRNFLITDEEDYYLALHYERAILQAAAGDASFVKSLGEAAQYGSRDGAYLTALNWAWLNTLERPNDYGILASQAQLWELMGRPDLAKRDYLRFEEEHRKHAEPRYKIVAEWVGQQANRLRAVENLATAPKDPHLLLLEARELSERDDKKAALQRLDDALGAVSEKQSSHLYVQLMLQRADIKFALKDYAGSEQDAEKVLALAKSATAYYYHARAMNWRDEEGTQKQVKDELIKALNLDPAYGSALSYLASFTSNEKEKLSLYQRLTAVWPASAWVYREIARLENKLGRHAEALQSMAQYLGMARLQDQKKLSADPMQMITAAIQRDGGNVDFYDIRAEVERGMAKSEDEVTRHQVEGYTQAIDLLLKRGKSQEAVEAYKKAKQLIASVPKESAEEASIKPSDGAPSRQIEAMQAMLATKEKEVYETARSLRRPEWVVCRVSSVTPGNDKVREATLEYGSNDGVTVGAKGDLYSKAAEKGRSLKSIGQAEVISTKPDSAVVRVTLKEASGDGLVQAGDLVNLELRVPVLPERSLLWTIVKNSITLVGQDKKTVYLDFHKMYLAETPKLVDEILDAMLAEIHEAARETRDQQALATKIEKGRFKDKTLEQALLNSNRDDVLDFLKYVNNGGPRAHFYGEDLNTRETYKFWVQAGSPEK